MIVLSRHIHESIRIGEQLTVTVGAIAADNVTFRFELESGVTFSASEFALQSGGSVPLRGGITLSLLEIRGDKVRIGIEGPSELTIARSEAESTDQAQRAGLHRVTAVLHVDQVLKLGEKLTASPTDIDEDGVRLLVRGELLGGPEDGVWINEAKELACNSVLSLGALVSLSLVGITGGKAMFHVIAPNHVTVTVA